MSESLSTLLEVDTTPSNLSPELQAYVRTPEFKTWFGDWESNPNGASKMPDESGEVVFRGMPDIQPGTAWHEKGFSSTTISESVAQGFARSAHERDGTGRVVRMVMPPGVRYLPMGTGEEEVVFEPGLTMNPFDYDAFASGAEGIGTVDVMVQKAIPANGSATTIHKPNID